MKRSRRHNGKVLLIELGNEMKNTFKEGNMKKKLSIIAILMSLLLVLMLSGCGGSTGADDSSTDSGSTDGGNSDVHEIYTIDDPLALSGVTNPVIPSRADIYKALDKVAETEKPIKIGFDITTLGNPFFVLLADSMEAYAEENGYEITVTVNENNSTTQSSNIESLVAQGVDVLIVDPNDVYAAAVDVERAVAAGVVVIGTGVAFPQDVPAVTTVLANSYENGFEAGKDLANQYEPDQEISGFIIYGGMGHPVSESRGNGMLAGLIYGRMLQSDAGAVREDAMLTAYNMWLDIRSSGVAADSELGIDIIATGNGGWTDEGGLTIGEDLLSANPDIDFAMCANDFMGMGFLRAVEARNIEDVTITSCADGSKEAMELVMEGKLQSTGYNSADFLAMKVIELIELIFDEGFDANNMRADTSLPAICINKDNVDQYYDPDLPFVKAADFEFTTLDD